MIHKNPYNAYRKATHTVSKTRQVVMLYEGILRNLKQAREAIEQKKIEERYNKLLRASEIIIGLQMSLDFNEGEEAAQALYDFYSSLDARVMQLQRSNDLAACDTIIEDVRAMHEVWDKIDRGEAADAMSDVDALAAAGASITLPEPTDSQDDNAELPGEKPTSSDAMNGNRVFSA